MIRINLLGQARPKTSRRPVDTGAALPLVFVGIGAAVGLIILGYFYHSLQTQLLDENAKIKNLQAQKTELMSIKQRVDQFEAQKKILQQRVSTIEELQRDRTGAQELLDMVANTVSRTENLWLTTMTRKGDDVSFTGASASVNAIANFITALKRSGYFQKVEIKESKQDERNTAIQTFLFEISAQAAPPQATPEATPARAPGKPAAAPAKKG
jgi:Tfp pilus assembly protein PilN